MKTKTRSHVCFDIIRKNFDSKNSQKHEKSGGLINELQEECMR